MSSNDKIDSLFKDGLRDFSPTPPAHLWDNIASGVAAARRKRRIAVLWLSTAASLALLITVGGALYFWPTTNETIKVVQSDIHSDTVSSNDGVVLQVADTEGDVKAYSADSHNPVAVGASASMITSVPQSTQVIVASQSTILSAGHNFANRPLLAAVAHVDSDGLMESRGVELSSQFDESAIKNKSLGERQKQQDKVAYTQSLMMVGASPSAATTPIIRDRRRVAIAAVANPTFSENDNSRLTNQGKSPGSTQNGLLALGGGVNVRMDASRRWSVESGVVYNRIGQNEKQGKRTPVLMMTSSNRLPAGETNLTHSNSLGTIQTKNISNQSKNRADGYAGISSSPLRYEGYQGDIRQVLDYVEIPLMARYRLIDRGLNVSLTGGVSANILADNNAFMFENSRKMYVGYTQDIENFAVSSAFGLNLEVPLFKSIYFNMEPRFKYFITPVNASTGYYPYTFSVLAGVAVHF